MRLRMGQKIVELRKSKGMTQEQLAEELGISPPAVSKWETDHSYPDITLLCPLARALDTDVDTLLSFEEQLTEEQITEHLNQILETARSQDITKAEQDLEELLHQYPSNVALKYHAYVALSAFEMFSPVSSEEKKTKWKHKKRELLEYVYENGSSVYQQPVISALASMALAESEFDKAEKLLKELPEHNSDPTVLWVLLYLKRGDLDMAKKTAQKRLYSLVNQIQSCLVLLMREDMAENTDCALEIGSIYQQVEKLFGCGGGMSEGVLMELYIRAGEKEKALDSICRYVEVLTGPAHLPKPLLFSKAFQPKEGQEASTQDMRRMMIYAMTNDEILAEFREDKQFQEALEKLKASVSSSVTHCE